MNLMMQDNSLKQQPVDLRVVTISFHKQLRILPASS